jgi:tetratricopeptide (TPR) repeat protein
MDANRRRITWNKYERCNNMRTAKYIVIISLGILLACGGAAKRGLQSSTPKTGDTFAAYNAYEHFIQGDLYEQAGDLDNAVLEYRKALILDPGSVTIRRTLSEIYFDQKKYDDAAILRSEITEKNADDYNFIGDCLRSNKELESSAKFYMRSLDLDSTQYMTRLYVARIMQYLGKEKEAEKQYKTLVNFSSSKIEGLLELANFYIKINKLDKALITYSEAAAIDSTDIRPTVGLASVYLTKGDTIRADSTYYSIAQKNWDDSAMLVSLSSLFFNLQNFKRAENLAARVAELQPDDLDSQRRYAMIVFGNGNFARAESLMTALDQKGGANAAIYYYLARIKQESKEFPASESYFRKSLALSDTVIDTWINLALVVDQQKRYQESIELMGKAMSAVPQDSDGIIFYTAIIHSRNDHFDLAKEGYERLLKSNPDDIGLRFSLASMQERLGNIDEAEKGFKWVIEKEPKNAMALNYLGYMYADQGVKLKESKELIERALVIDPENGAFLDSYAWVLYKLGKYDEALTEMKKAVKTELEDPVIYDHQGDIYSALKQEDLARESWEKALQLSPDDQAIRAKLNK